MNDSIARQENSTTCYDAKWIVLLDLLPVYLVDRMLIYGKVTLLLPIVSPISGYLYFICAIKSVRR